MANFLLQPNPDDPRLSQAVMGLDQDGQRIEATVVTERPLTLFLNAREIVTMMTIGDHIDLLAVGYLLNQHMLKADDEITAIEYEEDIETVVVRTARETNYEEKLKKKIRTSGCAQGTVFGDLMENFDRVDLARDAEIRTSWIYGLSRQINQAPSLYLKAGAIHGCVLCQENQPLVYMEDVGRHNAVDKIAGYMFLNKIAPHDKIFYTTGRLTSEMVIKTVNMGIPILISRSGFTAWGVDLAQRANLTLIGRAKGRRFIALAGTERLVFDADAKSVAEEEKRYQRKGSRHNDDDGAPDRTGPGPMAEPECPGVLAPACALCRSSEIVTLLEIDGKIYWRCHSCLLTFLDPKDRLAGEAERHHYLSHENEIDDPAYRAFLSRLADPLLVRLEVGSAGLDYGCGPGPALAHMLREAGHQVALYDPFFACDQSALAGAYDFVACTEVAEHFHDPAAEFQTFDRLIRRGGLLAIMTCFQTDDDKFASWYYRKDPTHVAFYKRETLAFQAGRMGWAFESPAKDVVFMRKPQ